MFFFIQFESLSLYPITTNEMANALRYSYLRGPGGRLQQKLLGFLVERCSGALTVKMEMVTLLSMLTQYIIRSQDMFILPSAAIASAVSQRVIVE
ncbi:unnamed protein product [Brassica oleracea]